MRLLRKARPRGDPGDGPRSRAARRRGAHRADAHRATTDGPQVYTAIAVHGNDNFVAKPHAPDTHRPAPLINHLARC